MTTILLMLVAFASAAALDLVVIAWHRAREKRDPLVGAALAMLHEALTWAPLLIALETGSGPALALAAIVGVGVANAFGLRRART